MTWQEILREVGINPEVFLAGGAGGILRGVSHKRITIVERILSPISGALGAAYLTIPVVHYLLKIGVPMPEDPQPALLATGFLVGTSSMWISDFIFKILTRKFGGGNPAT